MHKDYKSNIEHYLDPEIVSLARHHDRYGFVSLPGHTQQLFLPLETLRLAGKKIVLSEVS